MSVVYTLVTTTFFDYWQRMAIPRVFETQTLSGTQYITSLAHLFDRFVKYILHLFANYVIDSDVDTASKSIPPCYQNAQKAVSEGVKIQNIDLLRITDKP